LLLGLIDVGEASFISLAAPLIDYNAQVAERFCYCTTAFEIALGPVWQGSGSSKNDFGSGSSGGVASLVELSRFKKCLAK
jgi:hypothetical protein